METIKVLIGPSNDEGFVTFKDCEVLKRFHPTFENRIYKTSCDALIKYEDVEHRVSWNQMLKAYTPYSDYTD